MRSRTQINTIALAACVACVACGETPQEVIDSAFRSLAKGDVNGALERVDGAYSDTLGGKAVLAKDLEEFAQLFPKVTIRASEISVSDGSTKRDARAIGRLEVELIGNPTIWRYIGPLDVELVRDDGFKIRSGLLADLRDVFALMNKRRAALEGNDVDAYVRLLHPTYRDGDADLDTTRERIAHDLPGARVRLEPTLYKVESRGVITHVDEHYILSVGERTLPAAIARFTLRRAAGLWRISAGLYPDRS